METAKLVAAVKAHALDRYDDGFGWDYVIETYDDAEIAAVIGAVKSPKAAIAKMRKEIGPRGEARRDAIEAGR